MGHKTSSPATEAEVAMPPLWMVRVAHKSVTAKSKIYPQSCAKAQSSLLSCCDVQVDLSVGSQKSSPATEAEVAMPPLWLIRVAHTSVTAKSKFEPTLVQRQNPDSSHVVPIKRI